MSTRVKSDKLRTMSTAHFYKEISGLKQFPEICDFSVYSELPDDWHIIVADVANSTEAIQSGRYRAVNITGVSVITSILNIATPVEIPYIFGGDGASLCIPANLVPHARQALMATRKLALNEFSLVLRAGIIPYTVIHDAGFSILVSKHKVSRYCHQAAFAGGGIEYAESLLKSPDFAGSQYSVNITDHYVANYSGLECRWDSVPSKHGEIISLIVKALAPSLPEQAAFYAEVIELIEEIYGGELKCRPVTPEGLKPTYTSGNLELEARLKSFEKGPVAYLKYWLIIRLQNFLGWFFMKFKLNFAGVDWGMYKIDLAANTDYRKFDGVLRQVISGTAMQRENLIARLDSMHKKGKCIYGVHKSESALLTCLISNRSGEHYHFVDGADGGYAMAATEMKRQLKASAKKL